MTIWKKRLWESRVDYSREMVVRRKRRVDQLHLVSVYCDTALVVLLCQSVVTRPSIAVLAVSKW